MRSALTRFSLIVTLAAPTVGVACGRATQAGVGSGPPFLTFTNESADQTTVYAIRPGGDARRLAAIMPGRTDTLSLPATIATEGQVTIIAVPPFGNQIASTGPITLGPGLRLAIRLPPAANILSVLPIATP